MRRQREVSAPGRRVAGPAMQWPRQSDVRAATAILRRANEQTHTDDTSMEEQCWHRACWSRHWRRVHPPGGGREQWDSGRRAEGVTVVMVATTVPPGTSGALIWPHWDHAALPCRVITAFSVRWIGSARGQRAATESFFNDSVRVKGRLRDASSKGISESNQSPVRCHHRQVLPQSSIGNAPLAQEGARPRNPATVHFSF